VPKHYTFIFVPILEFLKKIMWWWFGGVVVKKVKRMISR
jgi:hypothetical protein